MVKAVQSADPNGLKNIKGSLSGPWQIVFFSWRCWMEAWRFSFRSGSGIGNELLMIHSGDSVQMLASDS